MRLINPGVGELVDRLTIIQLKLLQHGPQFRQELEALVNQLSLGSEDRHGWAAIPLRAITRLAAVNAVLWQLEDDLRSVRNAAEVLRSLPADPSRQDTTTYKAGLIGIRIQELNDERARLIAEISADGHEEKRR